ncbi:MAG: OmpP1/FadL family transporter [Desulfuromonadaceae bacterium]|nr:OmpP1/FadL family transporter [Desulfuromonadaceae bacterium]
MKNKLVVTCITAAVVGTATMSFGAGFKIAEQGAKAMAMGNAFAAQADDPSALAYNPAGIAFLKGDQAQIGTTTILVPKTKFTGTTRLSGATVVSEEANSDIFIAPTVYVTTSLESMPLSFGLGINAFHPLAKRWDESSAFRDSIQSISIKPINFQPTVAYRFDDLKLAVAGGFDITYAQVSLQKMAYTQLPAALGGAYAELGSIGADATGTGYGYNLGAQWKPLNNLSFGAAYRSEIKLELEGNANYLATTATGQNPAFGLGPKTIRTTGATDITLPDALTLGVAWKPLDKLTLEFDAERTGWSSYDKLELKFGTPLAAFNGKPDAKNWEDVWAYRFGAQYAVTPKFDLRAGYAYDNSPTPDSTLSPELPDADRHNFSIGSGLHNEYGAIDLAYMWAHWVDRTVANVANAKEAGTFQSDAHLFAISLTHKF